MRLKEKLLTIFGDIKLLKWPPFVYWQPGDYYKAPGSKNRIAIERIRPGDIILRGYDSYLDGYFIPGRFSHTGIYIGGGKVIHAVAEGVSEIDVLDFLRCDRFAVLRPSSGQKKAIDRVKGWLGKPYDFDFSSKNFSFYCHELAAEAYKELGIQKVTPYLGFIRFSRMEPSYLAESFLENRNFRTIMRYEE